MRRYLPFLLFLFLIAAVLRVDFFFTIAYLFFGVYVLGQLWAGRARRQIQIERRFVPRAFCGDEVPVRVTVRNTGRWPIPWLEAHESLPVELISPPFHAEAFSLGPHAQRHFTYQLQCRKRGVYRLGPFTAHTGDVLGVSAPQTLEAVYEAFIVYPRVVPLAALRLPTHSPLAALPARAPLFEDPARVTGVREYARGDSPRRIHWTATASAGRLLVKQYQPAIARETLIVLDLHRESYDSRVRYDAIELAVTTAASLATHIIVRDRLPVGLAVEALDGLTQQPTRFFLPPRPERLHLTHILETLARAQMAASASLAEVLRRERPRLAWGTTLLIITGQTSEAVLDELALLRRAGFAVAVVLVQAPHAPAAVQARAQLLRIPLHSVWNERELGGGL